MSTFGLVVSLNNSKLPLSVLVRVRQAPEEGGCPLTTSIYSFPSTAPATGRIAYRLLNSLAPTLQEAAKTPETHNQTKFNWSTKQCELHVCINYPSCKCSPPYPSPMHMQTIYTEQKSMHTKYYNTRTEVKSHESSGRYTSRASRRDTTTSCVQLH